MKTARQRFFAYVIFRKIGANQQKKLQNHVSLVKQKPHAKNQLGLRFAHLKKWLKNPSVVFASEPFIYI